MAPCSCCHRRNVAAPGKSTSPVEAQENQLVFYTAECSVCLGPFEENQKAIRLNCGHLFHEECLRSWLGVRDTCPFCNTAGARAAMRNVQVALINDPTRLHELNVYVAQGAAPLVCLWNASLLLTQDGREILICTAIRRSMLRWVFKRFPNVGRVMSVLLVVLVYIAANCLAKCANSVLQRGLEFAFDAFGSISILNSLESLGNSVQPVLLLLVMLSLLMLCCISFRANTIAPAPLTGEFRAQNICTIPAQQVEQPMIQDVTESEGVQSESTVAASSSGSWARPNTLKREHAGTQNEHDEEPGQKRMKT